MSTDVAEWKCRDRSLDLGAPVVMGVLNVTPDSFSDGGRFNERDAALLHARRMIEEGATIIDIGGESTRPGAASAGVDDELARVVPVIEALRRESDVFISVDTSKPEVMRAACAAGADIINDVRALVEPGALAAAISTRAGICLMHMQGEPRTMQSAPEYTDVVGEATGALSRLGRVELDQG
jgi:dihydropteroate synthase